MRGNPTGAPRVCGLELVLRHAALAIGVEARLAVARRQDGCSAPGDAADRDAGTRIVRVADEQEQFRIPFVGAPFTVELCTQPLAPLGDQLSVVLAVESPG